MEKAPDAFLTIGETAERLGVKTHILRYWEEQFPMLKPLKRAGGRRLYRPADVALLERIQDLLDRQGYTIRGARAFLAQKSVTAAVPAAEPITDIDPSPAPPMPADLFAAADDKAWMTQLQDIRNTLARALAVA